MTKDTNKNYIFAVGRRRESVARVRLYKDVKGVQIAGQDVAKGDLFVNNKKIDEYFTNRVSSSIYMEPLRSTNNVDKYAFTVRVIGGGQMGQLNAVVHGISRALAKIDEKNKDILRKKGFLTRDARVRQRRNVGMGGKARREKQSPKR